MQRICLPFLYNFCQIETYVLNATCISGSLLRLLICLVINRVDIKNHSSYIYRLLWAVPVAIHFSYLAMKILFEFKMINLIFGKFSL
jgi:hypothetical protein